MNDQKNLLVTAIAAFAGGLLAGMLYAPRSGKQTRQVIGRKVREQTRWVEERVHNLEQKLEGVEEQISKLKADVTERVRDVTQKTVEHYVPDVSKDSAEWDVEKNDVTDDLSRMPH